LTSGDTGTGSPEPFEIPCKDGLAIRGERYAADTAIGTVLLCHGFKGFAHWGFYPLIAKSLSRAGLDAITFDFSGSGIGADRESFTQPEAFSGNTFSRELEDLEVLVDYSRRVKWIDGKFGMFGHSRGGGTSILYSAAEGAEVNCLVTWAAISHANRWSAEEALDWRKRGFREVVNSRTGETLLLGTDLLDEIEAHGTTKVNILAAAGKVKAPWLLVHGTADETVPHAEGERLHERAAQVSTLRLIDGATHTFGATHPLVEPVAPLKKLVDETVSFLAANAGR
jgi:alpha-beta hydrolase superfamily lysophospholipase